MEPAGEAAPVSTVSGRALESSTPHRFLSAYFPLVQSPPAICPSHRLRRDEPSCDFVSQCIRKCIKLSFSGLRLICNHLIFSAICPRRESNPDLRFRKPPFYPLNYGGELLLGCDDFQTP